MKKPKRKRYIYRNSENGQIVTKKYADMNPDTTERETVDDNKKATD